MSQDHVAGSPWTELVAGASVVHQQAIEKLAVPALILELPCRIVRAANQAVAELFDVPVATLVGHANDAYVEFTEPEAMKDAVALISAGAIDGYRARRGITVAGHVSKQVYVWCRAVELEGHRFAAYIISPVPGEGGPSSARIDPPTAWTGPLVVGRVDSGWHIVCLSSDAREMLGVDPVAAVGVSLLSTLHPDDVPAFLDALEASPVEGTMGRRVRVRHHDGHWVTAQCLVVRLAGEARPPLVFALMPEPAHVDADADRVTELELRLHRIASELRAVGIMDGLEHLPTTAEFPQLNRLSSRQWQILARLLRGQRVSTIARELFVSPGTVRNHLTTIYEHFDVHSQAELIACLSKH